MPDLKIFDLSGKVALITGSKGGLGFAFARGLAQAGAKVVLNSRKEDILAYSVKGLASEGYEAYGYAFDVSNENDVNENIAIIEKEIGNIDILVNNAAVQERHNLEKFPEDKFREIIDINLTGAFIVAKSVVKSMIRNNKGKIINVTSMQSELSRETIAPYAASKGGLKMLTKAMTVEWAKHNIQINGIGPGYFITEMTGNLADNEEFNDWLKMRTPAGRWGQPKELVGTLVYLASDASSFVNGQVIYVDGGLLSSI